MDGILVSGATGFLGSAIVEELILTTNSPIYVLVRKRDGRTPEQRLESLWCERPVLRGALAKRVLPLEGDVESEMLGLGRDAYDNLANAVGSVIHSAAVVGVNETRQRFWNANVVGTANMLDFAKRAIELGGLNRFVHVSSSYAAGQARGRIEEELFAFTDYNSLYEQSKHEAELLVHAYGEEGVPYTIVRPAQIVGDSRTGFITTFNTLYYPLKLYLKGRLPVIPASRDLIVNMAPVDYVARIACRAVDSPQAERRVLNAVPPEGSAPRLGDLLDSVRLWASENLGVALPTPIYLPAGELASAGRRRNMREDDHPKAKGPLRNLAALGPYFFEDRVFETARAQAVAGVPFPDWHDFFPRLLEFAARRGFLNQSERTVYEQILHRLRPKTSTRINYFDVTSDGMERHEGIAVREEIMDIAHALMAFGVKPGDRIATVGVNSVRYFEIDAAIGLAGASNVPIYYTSPAEDVQALVAKSEAGLLLIGTDRMLEQLDLASLGDGVKVVSFNDRAHPRDGIIPWRDFLAGASHAQGSFPWTAPDQVATIRYTSGTTGEPKGVVFDQRQVRWMGEVMPAVLDWRTRTARKVRYLSFLPMSHVVEGILVAYAPYYILADIEMYYLNDFPALAEALPKVRPNLFFSVPRFYEKVWNQFAASGAGRYWIGLPEGPLKRALAGPLRAALLRRAGLDRCRQLIVGSAPIGLELLEQFRSLGIEIHNAFGVTEAPLITLSRLGANELGSVGQLLPETEARLDDDGQVLVRGPQVTRGYDGIDEPAVDEDGWFCTGDLGAWSPEGNLVLNGRKKDILVTSYGKNIAPQKIEVLLKGIDGVSEALVVADARPFTTALLWIEDESAAGFDADALDKAVAAVNLQLSHPEQVKRWVVVAEPLSIASGELTPNLKARRGAIAETRAAAIESLYDNWDDRDNAPVAAGILHWGEAR